MNSVRKSMSSCIKFLRVVIAYIHNMFSRTEKYEFELRQTLMIDIL
jgi:hypothetical protein